MINFPTHRVFIELVSPSSIGLPLKPFHGLPQEMIEALFPYVLYNHAEDQHNLTQSTQTHSGQFTCKPQRDGLVAEPKLAILKEPCNFEKALAVYPDLYEAFRAYRARHSMFVAGLWKQLIHHENQER
jgi:hypothetical protein